MKTSLVGCLIINSAGQIFIQRRSLARRLYPGAWDIVGGKIEIGETREEALCREIQEETGWALRNIVAWICDITVDLESPSREEVALVTVDDADTPPVLEAGKAIEFAWLDVYDPTAKQNIAEGWGDYIPSVVERGFSALARLAAEALTNVDDERALDKMHREISQGDF